MISFYLCSSFAQITYLLLSVRSHCILLSFIISKFSLSSSLHERTLDKIVKQKIMLDYNVFTSSVCPFLATKAVDQGHEKTSIA